jgi:hypothetical protein
MAADKNDFGGGNSKSLYIPMSEIEMEFISRLVDSKDLYVLIHDWGHVNQPIITFGDKNLHVAFKMVFDRPEVPMPVYHFDMELKTRSGICLYREKMTTVYGGQPLNICQGVELDMVWDISIRFIDPKLVKAMMPNTLGLTTRLEDTATHDITVTGNMKLNKDLTDKAYHLHKAEKYLKALDKIKIETKS